MCLPMLASSSICAITTVRAHAGGDCHQRGLTWKTPTLPLWLLGPWGPCMTEPLLLRTTPCSHRCAVSHTQA